MCRFLTFSGVDEDIYKAINTPTRQASQHAAPSLLIVGFTIIFSHTEAYELQEASTTCESTRAL